MHERGTMNLLSYDGKYVRLTDNWGNTFTGHAEHQSADYCFHEYGVEEEGLRVEGCIVYHSQIASVKVVEMRGTAELFTERLTLRRYRPDDAADLYERFGTDETMFRYSGWNPYATPEMAQETVQRFIASYEDDHSYSWIMDFDDELVGTIGAYDGQDGRIEVGFSVARVCWGRGYAAEALQAVLRYLTENEGFHRVTAWCAAENVASRKTMEKAGMQLVSVEKDGLAVGNHTFDKLNFEYRTGAGRMDRIEELLKKPYWIIDILPKQVPKDSHGQYFAIEKYLLEKQLSDIKRKHLNVILKLNCYLDIAIDGEVNPPPAKVREIMDTRYVYIMINDAMILSEPDDTHLTVFNPDEPLIQLICSIASSEGLFVWQPPQA